MIIIGVIISIVILWLLGVLTENLYLCNVMTSVILIMAIIQAPLFYYYFKGLLSPFEIGFYAIIGVGLTISLFLIIKNKTILRTKFQKYGLYATIIIGTLSLLFGNKVVEYLDWKLRRNYREEIVVRFKNKNHKSPFYKLKDSTFPHNEIMIDKSKNGKLTIDFYIDQGFIDHYSAFVYSDNPTDEKEFKSSSNAKQLDNNWYKISK